MMDVSLRARVAGVTFAPGYPNNLLDLVDRLQVEDIVVDLVREYDNAHDLNAITVQLEGRPLGHLPADVAVFVAPQMDQGVLWQAEAVYVAVDVEHRDRPGLELELTKEN